MKSFTYTNENVTITISAENEEAAFEKLKSVAESDYDQFTLYHEECTHPEECTLEKMIIGIEAWQRDLFKIECSAVGTGKADYIGAHDAKIKWEVLNSVVKDLKKITQ